MHVSTHTTILPRQPHSHAYLAELAAGRVCADQDGVAEVSGVDGERRILVPVKLLGDEFLGCDGEEEDDDDEEARAAHQSQGFRGEQGGQSFQVEHEVVEQLAREEPKHAEDGATLR